MKSTTITLLISIFFLSAYSQIKFNCEKILNSEPEFIKNKSGKIDNLFIKDMEIVKECGNFDSIDIELMAGPMLAPLMIQQATANKTITYKAIIENFAQFKKSDEYKDLYEKTFVSKQLENKIVDVKDWEENKPLFIKLGLSEQELVDLKDFIIIQSGLKLTYKQVFAKYATNNKVKVEKNSSATFNKLIDYDIAIKSSQQQKKPLLLFFTGYACVNVRKMEDGILADPNIKSILNEKFICFAAFVDDHSSLDSKDEFISKRTGKKITTFGGKFIELEMEKFNNSSQPFFVIIDNNNEILATTGYLNDKDKFIEFLNKEKK